MAKNVPNQTKVDLNPSKFSDAKFDEELEDRRLERKHKDQAFNWALWKDKLFTGVILIALLFATLWAGYSLFYIPADKERALTFITGLFGGVFGQRIAAKSSKRR